MNRIASPGEPAARTLAAWLLWPATFGLGLLGTHFALASPYPVLWFNAVYLTTIAVLAVCERLMPFHPEWLEQDSETFNDVAHTLLSKGAVQLAVALVSSAGMLAAMMMAPEQGNPDGVWPSHWPLLTQVALGLVVAELGLYIAHRGAHEWMPLWRFHALHHSVERLWVVNTGRFHFVDSLLKIVLSQVPLYFLGAPLAVFLWISAVTAFIGLLTHCNVDMRTGVLDWVFSTPNLHRWHHSRVLAEGKTNYCENVVLWDLVFGTWFNPPRKPPADIGIDGYAAAPTFVGQLMQPFTENGRPQ